MDVEFLKLRYFISRMIVEEEQSRVAMITKAVLERQPKFTLYYRIPICVLMFCYASEFRYNISIGQNLALVLSGKGSY